MSRKVSRRKFMAGTAAGAVAATFKFPAPAIAQAAPFKLGLLTIKTGPLAQGGIQMEQGVITYLKEKDNTFAGRKVDFVSADTGGSPAGAKTKAQELVERDKVDTIIGPLAAFELLAITDYIAQAKTPLLSLAAAEDLTQRRPNPYFLRASACSSQAMHPMADYAAKEMKLKNMITISEDFAFGYEQMGGFQQTFEDNGGKILKKLWPPLATPDYTPYLAQIADCDGVCQGFAGGNPLKFMKQYASAGLKFPVVTGQTGGDDALLRSYGDEAVGLVSCCPYTLDRRDRGEQTFRCRHAEKLQPRSRLLRGRPLYQLHGHRRGTEEVRRQQRRQSRIYESSAIGVAHRYTARAGEVRPPRKRGRQLLHPQMRKGRRQARQQDGQDLSKREPVLDLRRTEVPPATGLFARLPAAQIIMQDVARAPYRRPRFFDTTSAGRRQP